MISPSKRAAWLAIAAALIALLGAIAIFFRHTAPAGPEMKVVVEEDGRIGRYVSEDADSYLGEIQDTYRVGKDSARVEVMRAADGKGILTLKEPGKAAVYVRPSVSSNVVGTMIYEEGYIPEVYPCLGYAVGWFRTEIDGQTGYIKEEKVDWNAVDSF